MTLTLLKLLFYFMLSAIELIRDLMSFDVRPKIMHGLVKLLRPSKDDIDSRPEILDGKSVCMCVCRYLYVCCMLYINAAILSLYVYDICDTKCFVLILT